MEYPNQDTLSRDHTEEPASVDTALNPQGTYRNLGVGRRESPFADSPYETLFDAEPDRADPESGAPDPEPEVPAGEDAPAEETDSQPAEPAAPKKRSGIWKKLLAAAASVAILAGSCAITAWTVNRRWEQRTAQLENDLRNQMSQMQSQLQAQINAHAAGNSGNPGTPGGTSGGLTPAQVYAQNVNSVVAVSNYANTNDRWGSSGSYLAGTGSGFIISADGYIITNYHVVENAQKLTITTHDGTEYTATLIGSDQINDVALLKVDAAGLDPVEIGSSDALLVGDMVIAIGNPLGELTSTATVGYVSGKDRSISTDGTIINMLQTDAAINSGNSGGPLFNSLGQVIGITTAKYSGSTTSGATIEGIGFAIPIDDVLGMIEDFKAYGYLRNQAYLGVTVMDLDPTTASMYYVPSGSFVQGVVTDGCADKAGIQPGDIIIAVGEYTITGNTSLTTTLRRFSAGDSTTVTVYRDGKEITLNITFDERPQNAGEEPTEPLEQGEMPNNGSYDEWREYFDRYFGMPEDGE